MVPLLADRDDYDDDPVFNVDGSRMSVLVESDSSNDDLPTLYFKESNAPAVCSGGVTFQAAGAADAVSYDNTTSGYLAINVQDAIDEGAAEKVDKAGDTMTGSLTLSGDPIAALHAVPRQYVDAKPALIISDTPPPTPLDGSMWWDADIGTLYVRYNDGAGPSQWVQATAVPFLDTSTFVKVVRLRLSLRQPPTRPTPTCSIASLRQSGAVAAAAVLLVARSILSMRAAAVLAVTPAQLRPAADIGASKAVTIGAGGAGTSASTGGSGGTTSVGTLVIANGGLGLAAPAVRPMDLAVLVQQRGRVI